MAFTSIGSITASQLFATQSWPIGTKNLGPATLPSRFSFGVLILDLSQVTDLLAKISVAVQVAQNGVDFVDIGGFALDLPISGCELAVGGVGLVDQFGVPFLSTSLNLRFPQGALGTRTIKGTVTLTQPAVVGMTLGIW